MSHDKGRTFDVIKRSLDDLGYDIHPRIVDGAHFVPQHRERILIVGFRKADRIVFDWNALPLPPKGVHTMKDILHRTDGTEPLDVGMCFSNEPMICIPGEFGIRHEDHFYMTQDGPRWFTQPAHSIDDPFGLHA